MNYTHYTIYTTLYTICCAHHSVHTLLYLHTHIHFYAIPTRLYVLYYTHENAHTVHTMLYTPVFYHTKHIVHTVLTFLAVDNLLCILHCKL